MTSSSRGHLVCVSEFTKNFSFGNNPQISDLLWIRFLQEVDAYNQGKVAEDHLCPDKSSSWHYHIINLAMELDPKFIELALNGPLLVSITINDRVGASNLYNKAIKNFPNDWRILYQASYQALIEEEDLPKAADLLHRAAILGAPLWVYSLAGGVYNHLGQAKIAESIYEYLSINFPENEATHRLKKKLLNKQNNFFKLKK